MSADLDWLHERGVECLEGFRLVFNEQFRARMKLTLIARDPDAPDGRHDVLITDDTATGIKAAATLWSDKVPS